MSPSTKSVSPPLGCQAGMMVPLALKKVIRRFALPGVDVAPWVFPGRIMASRNGSATAMPPAPFRTVRRLSALTFMGDVLARSVLSVQLQKGRRLRDRHGQRHHLSLAGLEAVRQVQDGRLVLRH